MSTTCNFMPDNLKPKYIVLFKGDDTNFPGNQNISLVIDTELDLTGMKAHFRFMDFVQDFNEIPENKTFNIVIPHEKTSAFPIGSSDATLTLEDPSGKIRTISNRIHVVVTNSVREAYDNEDSQSVTVTVKGTVTWDMIEGKPDVPEASDEEPLMDGEASSGVAASFSRGDHRHPSDTSKRDVTNLGVRGAPIDEGSWFVVDGYILTKSPLGAWWSVENLYEIVSVASEYQLNEWAGGSWTEIGTFALNESFSSVLEGHTIVGYVDTIAKVSEIPAVDASLTEPGAAADAKAVGDALRSGFTEWEFSGGSSEYPPNPDSLSWSEISNAWIFEDSHYEFSSAGSSNDDIRLLFPNIFCDDGQTYNLVATRHLITPTKTSQLTNNSGFLTSHQDISGKLDGAAAYPAWEYKNYASKAIVSHNGRLWKNREPDNNQEPSEEVGWIEVSIGELKQDALSSQQIGYVNAVPGKADKAVPSAAGNLASLNAQGNLEDSGVKPSDFAAKADLPYLLVEPGKWEFGGDAYQGDNYTVEITGPVDGYYTYNLMLYTDRLGSATYTTDDVLSIPFRVGPDAIITATRPSLPGHLCDRSGNRVVVSGDTTLTLPAANPGHLRDFLVRLEISGSTVPTITFSPDGNESVTYETDGDEFPVPDESGTWLYSFTESCVSHKFAVALKKVNEVAQGGA